MSNSSNEESFFKFGADDAEKLKKRQELRLEYEKFKIMDEERFRNRFASKKTTQSYQNPQPQANVLKSSAESTGVGVLDLLQRLDKIQTDVNDLKKAKLSSGNLGILESSNNETLKVSKECNITNDLSSTTVLDPLEKPALDINQADNNATSNSHTEKAIQFRNVPSQHSGINSLHNFEESLEVRERMKQIQKEKYARELQQQIQENRDMREKMRQKEREEKILEYESAMNQNSVKPVVENDPGSEPPKIKQHSYARGGNGIFGEPLTESQKHANKLYRADLLQQMAEKQQRDAKMREQVDTDETKEEDNTSEASKANINPEPALVSSSAQQPVRKHSACVQVALENKFPVAKPKPLKVVRKTKPPEPTSQVQRSEDLLSQIVQLKIELAAERKRVGQEASKEAIQVYDPRSALLGAPPSFPTTNFTLPAKVTVSPPIKLFQPIPVRLNHSAYGQSHTPFDVASNFPQMVSRSPSVGSLNLRTINKKIRLRLDQFKSSDDLYRNEEPIIQEFMAREGAKGS